MEYEYSVTVIIPVHNAQNYLAECLDSVFGQKLKNVQVICVDDCSDDNSAQILNEYSIKNRNLHIYTNKTNIGAARSRNFALDCALGQYVVFMDSDDKYPNAECLSVLYNAAKHSHAKIVVGSFSEYDCKKEKLVTSWPSGSHFYNYKIRKNGWIKYCDWQMDFGFHRCMFKKEFINKNKIRFPDLTRHEDPVFLVDAMVKAGSFYGVKNVVYWYRLNYKPVALSYKNLDDAIDGISMNLDVARSHGYDNLKKWCIEFLYWSFSKSPMFMEQTNKVNQLEDDNEKMLHCNDALKNEIQKLDRNNSELNNKVVAYAECIDKIMQSKSYKIGRAITAPVRCARDILKIVKDKT